MNTIRIITFIVNGRIEHAPLAMRIGANGAVVDNIHSGGLTIGVSDEGELGQFAFAEYGDRYERHPQSGIIFKGYKIHGVPDAIKLVQRLHMMIPRLIFISWDVTIDSDGKPIIVEMNTRNQSAWFPQMVNGRSIFGKNTVFMIKKLRLR